MDLRTAMTRAAKIAARKGPLAGLLLTPNFVVATDGLVTSLIEVDQPDSLYAWLPYKETAAFARKCEAVKRVVRRGKVVDLEGVTKEGQTVLATIPLLATEAPGVPTLPKLLAPVETWRPIPSIVHAAGGKDAPDLDVIRFDGKGGATTYDHSRLAHIDVGEKWQGAVPAAIFRSWPAGAVEVKWQKDRVVWKIGEEWRLCQRGEINGHEGSVGEYDGSVVTCKAGAIKEAVATTRQLSPVAVVTLTARRDRVVVRSWVDADCSEVACLAEVESQGSIKEAEISVDGRFLVEAFRGVKTPSVALGFPKSPRGALRLDAGHKVELIWAVHVELLRKGLTATPR